MMHPFQIEMLAKARIEDLHREAARYRAIRSARPNRRRAVLTWRCRVGDLLVRTGLALQGSNRARRAMVRGQVECPALAADPR